MRRLIAVALVIPALAAGLVAALVVANQPSGTEQAAWTPPPTTVPTTAQQSGSDVEVIPDLGLDLPPMETDPAWYTNAYAPGSVGVVWVSRTGSDPSALLTSDRRRTIYASLLECFPDNATPEQLFEAKQTCFDERVIKAAASEPDPIDVFAAVAALNKARPDVFTVCHNASHKVGEIALRRVVPVHGMSTEIITALLDAGGRSCMGGMMHGVLDAVGLLATSVEEFAPAVQACMAANQNNLGYCSDAVGHATWDAFANVEKAGAVCAKFPAADQRRECGEGVLMRIYQRQEVQDPWYLGGIADDQMDEWVSAINDICEAWPDTPYPDAPTENPREWCWSGSVYLFFKPVFHVLESNGGNFEASRARLMPRVQAVVDACAAFPSPGDELCLARSGPYAGHVGTFEIEYAAEVCALFPTPAWVEKCNFEARSRIDAAYTD